MNTCKGSEKGRADTSWLLSCPEAACAAKTHAPSLHGVVLPWGCWEEQMSSPGLHFPEPLAARCGHVTSSHQWNARVHVRACVRACVPSKLGFYGGQGALTTLSCCVSQLKARTPRLDRMMGSSGIPGKSLGLCALALKRSNKLVLPCAIL